MIGGSVFLPAYAGFLNGRFSWYILCRDFFFCHFFSDISKRLFKNIFTIIYISDSGGFMRYTPKKNGTAKIISFTCVLVGCLLLATVFLDVKYKVIYEIIALLFYVYSFELLFRYVFTEYTYILDEGNFIVMKRMGRRQMYACNVSMTTALDIVKTPKTKDERIAFAEKFGRVKVRYNYCQVIRPKDAYSYLFEFNGEAAEIVFQPDDRMLEEIRRTAAANGASDDTENSL